MGKHTEKALELCRILYEGLKDYGYYPALTGGSLYKDGERKDFDIVIYRNRENLPFEIPDIEKYLSDCGVKIIESFGFVTKCTWEEFDVDLFNPESKGSNTYTENMENVGELFAEIFDIFKERKK